MNLDIVIILEPKREMIDERIVGSTQVFCFKEWVGMSSYGRYGVLLLLFWTLKSVGS